MTGANAGLVLSVYLACSVEAVEALTIVLAVGQARSWPSALAGAGTSLAEARRAGRMRLAALPSTYRSLS